MEELGTVDRMPAGASLQLHFLTSGVNTNQRFLWTLFSRAGNFMKLNFSFRDIDPIWFTGVRQFPDKKGKVKISISAKSSTDLPSPLDIGELLSLSRGNDSAVTLLLTYPHSITSPRTTPVPEGEWYEEPNQTVWGQIRIALPKEPVNEIRQVSAETYGYELTLRDVELVNITPTKRNSGNPGIKSRRP